LALLPCLLLAACINTGDRSVPIPTRTVLAGAAPGDTLVVVLPGRWDNIEVMAGAGIADAVQGAWPEADVLLTSATMAYYTDGQLAARLHQQVVSPARERGYQRIWMMGASLGGMGTLLYEEAYPGELDGLVLLAPYLGRNRVLREIADAGGIGDWSPGPRPAERNRSNFDRELWRHLQTWLSDPSLGRRAWLAYGDEDRLRDAVPVFAPLLPDAQILERPGGHAWSVWVPAAGEVLTRARQQHTATALGPR
jgi:pimeloyl-ACP methyl ester carboxylesterase